MRTKWPQWGYLSGWDFWFWVACKEAITWIILSTSKKPSFLPTFILKLLQQIMNFIFCGVLLSFSSHQNHLTCNPHPISNSQPSSLCPTPPPPHPTHISTCLPSELNCRTSPSVLFILKLFVTCIFTFGNQLLYFQHSLRAQFILSNSFVKNQPQLQIQNMQLICKWKFSDTQCILIYLTCLSAPHRPSILPLIPKISQEILLFVAKANPEL